MKREFVFIALIVSSFFLASCEGSSEPPYFGVFLEEDGELLEMVEFRGEPDSPTAEGIPSTSNPEPVIVMWNPNVVLDYLTMSSLTAPGRMTFNVSPRDGDILEIRATGPLADDTYCFTQGNPLLGVRDLSNWCFRVGQQEGAQLVPSSTLSSSGGLSGDQPTSAGQLAQQDVTPVGACEPIIGEWQSEGGDYWLRVERTDDDTFVFSDPTLSTLGRYENGVYRLTNPDPNTEVLVYCANPETLVLEIVGQATFFLLRTTAISPDDVLGNVDRQTCNGWALHILEVSTTDLGDGWAYLEGVLGFENVSAGSGQYIPLYDFVSQPPAMRTAEGFSYTMAQLDTTLPNSMVSPEWVPPGLRYWGVEGAAIDSYQPTAWTLGFKVASTTSGHTVDTPCGTLDFSSEGNRDFPPIQDEVPTIPLGIPLQLPEGELTFTSGTNCENGSNCFSYNFLNRSQGYEVANAYYVRLLTFGGVLYRDKEGIGDCCIRINAGPGQSTNGLVSFLSSPAEASYLIVARWPLNGEYWIVKYRD